MYLLLLFLSYSFLKRTHIFIIYIYINCIQLDGNIAFIINLFFYLNIIEYFLFFVNKYIYKLAENYKVYNLK